MKTPARLDRYRCDCSSARCVENMSTRCRFFVGRMASIDTFPPRGPAMPKDQLPSDTTSTAYKQVFKIVSEGPVETQVQTHPPVAAWASVAYRHNPSSDYYCCCC